MAKSTKQNTEETTTNLVAEKMKEAIKLTTQIEEYQAKIKRNKNLLEPIDEFFGERLQHGEIIETDDGIATKVDKNEYSLVADEAPRLQKYFGKFAESYIKEEIKYKHTAALLDIWKNPESENYSAVFGALTKKTTTSIKYEKKS